MIGNDYLQRLFNCPDENTGLNQLLEMLANSDTKFIESLKEPVDYESLNDEERAYLIKVLALIDYYLQIFGIDVPDWIRDERLAFDRPYYHSNRISDFEKLKLQFSSPSPFRARNVYFDLNGIQRV